jgi:hypothetical protein
VTGEPEGCVRVEFGGVAIDFLGGVVIPILVFQRFNNACRVAFVRRRLTIAHLSPAILASLTAAATEEEVIVDFVVGCRPRPVEHGGGCAL